MPLAGGAADKFGNRYEGKWTVLSLCGVLRGTSETIRLEPPGPEGEGVEFYLEKGSKREYHQVKRQRSRTGGWTIAALQAAGVMEKCALKLREPDASFHFVSTQQSAELAELSQCARDAKDVSEYESLFLTSEDKRVWFSDIVGLWCDERGPLAGAVRVKPAAFSSGEAHEKSRIHHGKRLLVFEYLKRVYIHTYGEADLTCHIEESLGTLIRGNRSSARCVLAGFCLEKVHHALDADALWERLRKGGFGKQPLAGDACLGQAISDHNARCFGDWKWAGDEPFERPELNDITGAVAEGSAGAILLESAPGAGKTGILQQVVTHCQETDVPCLYLSVAAAVAASGPDALGEWMGLPASPVKSLVGFAGERHSVFIVDQLDAVSALSGQHPEFLDCVSQMVERALGTRTVTVLVACRSYDLANDHRLKRVLGDESKRKHVLLSAIPRETVSDFLVRIGIDVNLMTQEQWDYYSVPLHLQLLHIATDAEAGGHRLPCRPRDLLGVYWQHMLKGTDRRVAPRESRVGQVVDTILERQAVLQSLWVPSASVYDDHYSTVEGMLSEGILHKNLHQIAFCHQEIADYALGRRFVAKGNGLSLFLHDATEQHLSYRRMVTQVLREERRSAPTGYTRNLQDLLLDDGVRYHLKRTAIDFVANAPDPMASEWRALQAAMAADDNALARDIRVAIWGSPAWLVFLKETGHLQEYLGSGDEYMRQLTVRSLRQHAHSFPDMVVELLEPYLERSEEWNSLLWRNLRFPQASGAGRCVFDLFLRLVDLGLGDDSGGEEFWQSLWQLSKGHPDWAAQAIGHYLSKVGQRLPDSLTDAWRFLEEDSKSERILMRTAAGAPKEFLDHVLPFFLTVIRRSSLPIQDEGLSSSSVWSWRMYRSEPLSCEDAIMMGLEKALSILAADKPQLFPKFRQQLEDTHSEAANFLLVRAYTKGAESFANEALDYLCDKPARLGCGWTSASGGDFEFWAARELISAIGPRCDGRKLPKLRRVLLSFDTAFARTAAGRKQREYAQFVLVSALPPGRLDGPTRARLEELRRRFDREQPEPPRGMAVSWGMIGSPIGSESAAKMNDEQWLAAIARYQRGHDECAPEDRLKGGAHALARTLEEETKKDPKKFCALALQIPPASNPTYFESVLLALKESDVNKEDAFAVVRYCHDLPGRPCGRYIGHPIGKFADDEIPEDILGILAWYADNDPDPQDELWRESPERETVYYGGKMVDAAINSVRGTIAGTIRELIWNRPDRFRFFGPQIERLATDHIVAVRAEAATILLAALGHDRDRAVSLFVSLCKTDEDRLLNTYYVEEFIMYALSSHYQSLRPILARMIRSSFAEVREAGARLNAIAHFGNPEAVGPLEHCLSAEDASLRMGCARVAAANITDAGCRDFCLRVLPALFRDLEPDVRNAAATFLQNLEGEFSQEFAPLLEAFLDSPAFPDNADVLVRALEQSTSRLPDLTFQVCKRLIDLAGGGESDDQSSRDSATLAQLLFRIYRQTDSEPIQTQCLELMDNMLRAGIWGVTEQLSELDR